MAQVPEITVEADGQRWEPVVDFAKSGPDDRHYVLTVDDDDRAMVRFGDGQHGARLPTGTANISATYRIERGSSGVTVRMESAYREADPPQELQVVIRISTNALSFKIYERGGRGSPAERSQQKDSRRQRS